MCLEPMTNALCDLGYVCWSHNRKIWNSVIVEVILRGRWHSFFYIIDTNSWGASKHTYGTIVDHEPEHFCLVVTYIGY